MLVHSRFIDGGRGRADEKKGKGDLSGQTKRGDAVEMATREAIGRGEQRGFNQSHSVSFPSAGRDEGRGHHWLWRDRASARGERKEKTQRPGCRMEEAEPGGDSRREWRRPTGASRWGWRDGDGDGLGWGVAARAERRSATRTRAHSSCSQVRRSTPRVFPSALQGLKKRLRPSLRPARSVRRSRLLQTRAPV